ncbi:MAG: hypothetical protein HQ574_09425 [Chloroflexi bacterium]|nr:hypothetical protein [Chloroflexota bacterium]
MSFWDVQLRFLFSLPKRLGGVIVQIERGEIKVQALEFQAQLAGIEKNPRGLPGRSFLRFYLLVGCCWSWQNFPSQVLSC